MFKAIVLCELHNLSDDQVEYELRDRPSFVRFLGLGREAPNCDAKTIWLSIKATRPAISVKTRYLNKTSPIYRGALISI